jgi:hypothetical protein
MTVRINKDAINLREKLSELDKPSGLVGEELLRADTSADAREALNLEEHLFEDFESTGIDDNATSTAVTIDSSGNLLVGTTSAQAKATIANTNITNSAQSLLSLQANASNESATTGYDSSKQSHGIVFDRLWNGGANTETARIESYGVAGYKGGVVFKTNNIGGAGSTATTESLVLRQDGSAEFKNGVYLGGTGAANKLDDYEEGNWTPTALNYDGTLTVDSATYVKVGALVTIKAKVSFDATADASGVNLSNLPFVTTGVDKANGGFIVSSTVSSAARMQELGTGSFYLMTTDDSNIPYTTMASTSLEFVAIYETNQ